MFKIISKLLFLLILLLHHGYAIPVQPEAQEGRMSIQHLLNHPAASVETDVAEVLVSMSHGPQPPGHQSPQPQPPGVQPAQRPRRRRPGEREFY